MRYKYIAYKYTRRMRPDTAFQGLWESVGSWPLQSAIVWRPPTDIYETPDEIVVVIELAGVAEEDMNVTLFSDLLVVEGQRKSPITDMNACHQLGIKYGHFICEIDIHARVDHDKIDAEYKNGLLKISLQKFNKHVRE
ncbi:MAG TPA: Hsp20/alpha crystallin family protein [Nitrospirota bacterium]|nr:Hsp20/alpha crystallin family protein [Nitrospirota bacterium]